MHADRYPESCQRCAYDLGGLDGRVCPECGFEQRAETSWDRWRVRVRRRVLSGLWVGSGALVGWGAVSVTTGLLRCEPVSGSSALAAVVVQAAVVAVAFGAWLLGEYRCRAFVAPRARRSRSMLGAMHAEAYAQSTFAAVVFVLTTLLALGVWRSMGASPSLLVFAAAGLGGGIVGASGIFRTGPLRGPRANDASRWALVFLLTLLAPAGLSAVGDRAARPLLRAELVARGMPEDAVRRAMAWAEKGYGPDLIEHPVAYAAALLPAALLFERPGRALLGWLGLAGFLIVFGWPGPRF